MAIVHNMAEMIGKPLGRNTDHLAEDWISKDLPIARCANQNLMDWEGEGAAGKINIIHL
jgi:hypothetical protein